MMYPPVSAMRAPDVRPPLFDTLLRGAEVARRGHDSVTRASAWLSKLVLRLAVIALVVGVGLVALIYFAARSLG